MFEILFYLLVFAALLIWAWLAITTAVIAVAKRRNPVFWIFAGMLSGPIAPFILARLPHGTSLIGEIAPSQFAENDLEWVCPQCGSSNLFSARACVSCGKSVSRSRVGPPRFDLETMGSNTSEEDNLRQ